MSAQRASSSDSGGHTASMARRQACTKSRGAVVKARERDAGGGSQRFACHSLRSFSGREPGHDDGMRTPHEPLARYSRRREARRIRPRVLSFGRRQFSD